MYLTLRAFLDPYAKYQLFSDGSGGLNMDEFIDAREVVASLSAEYEACERPDYVSLVCACRPRGWCGVRMVAPVLDVCTVACEVSKGGCVMRGWAATGAGTC